MDEDVEFEKSQPCYDGRLFIFFERYTLENYFIETDILCDFLRRKSVDIKNLIPLLSDKDKFRKDIADIIDEISECLTKIGAANLTIRAFDNSESFLEDSIRCDEIEQRRLSNRLNCFPPDDVKCQFDCFEAFIRQTDATQKFASGKKYFSYQFNQQMARKGVEIQLNNHKSGLADSLQRYGLPGDFRTLLNFLLYISNHKEQT
ncbi:hypothetical protein QUF72_11920 [Desulfobacterales bacterium HSG2]|nr:hypothetical protein [Desulfobacterales bacterium HSG2]